VGEKNTELFTYKAFRQTRLLFHLHSPILGIQQRHSFSLQNPYLDKVIVAHVVMDCVLGYAWMPCYLLSTCLGHLSPQNLKEWEVIFCLKKTKHFFW